MLSVLFIGVLVLAAACTSKNANVFPGNQWERSSPAEQGINEEGMKRAPDYLKDHSKHNENREKADGAMKLPGAPQLCYFASGLNNNKCTGIAEWKMVVVRMGEDGHPENQDIIYGTFLKLLGKSILDKN